MRTISKWDIRFRVAIIIAAVIFALLSGCKRDERPEAQTFCSLNGKGFTYTGRWMERSPTADGVCSKMRGDAQ